MKPQAGLGFRMTPQADLGSHMVQARGIFRVRSPFLRLVRSPCGVWTLHPPRGLLVGGGCDWSVYL